MDNVTEYIQGLTETTDTYICVTRYVITVGKENQYT